MKTKKILQIDVDTGEQLEGTTAWVQQKYYFQENHLTMFQDALEKLATLNLSKDEYRVFNLIIAKAGMGNVVAIPFTEMAKSLNMQKQHITRAIKNLADKNIVIKGEKKIGKTPSIRINYGLAWKGKIKDYKINKYADPEININPDTKSKQRELFKDNGEVRDEWRRDKDYTQFKK